MEKKSCRNKNESNRPGLIERLIAREMIKTAIENKQNLVMSDKYIEDHFDNIKKFASVIEDRLDDEGLTIEMIRRDNARMLKKCIRNGAEYILIDEDCRIDIEL